MNESRISPNKPTVGDVIAAFSVTVVLVPQALAYSELAGMPPHHGLYAAALPTIVAALFASSRYLQTGPGAMTSLLTLGALTPLVAAGSAEYVGLAALLALIVGITRVVVGSLRAGWITYLMSQPVLTGFTTAAAILIVASQIPTAVGTSQSDGTILARATAALTDISAWGVPSTILGIGTAILVYGSRYVHRLFPGVLIAVVAGLVFSHLTSFEGSTIGAIPTALPPFSFDFRWSALPQLLVPGVVIALVGFAEAAAIAQPFATQDREFWNPDKEFVSQGTANLISGLSGGFPVGGSFSRSAINRYTGGQTRWSGAMTGALILAFLPFANILHELPRAVLSGIVIGAVANLVRLRELWRLIRVSPFQAGVAWTTFAATLILSPRVDLAILIGIGLSIFVHLFRESKISLASSYDQGQIHLTPKGVLYFGSAPGLDRAFRSELARHPDATQVVIELAKLGRVDYTGALALKRVAQDASRAGLTVQFTGIPPHATGIIDRVFGADWDGERAFVSRSSARRSNP